MSERKHGGDPSVARARACGAQMWLTRSNKCQVVRTLGYSRLSGAWRRLCHGREFCPGGRRARGRQCPNVIFTEPPTGAVTPYLGGSICGLAPARPPPTAPAPSSPRSGIRENGIGDGGQQAATRQGIKTSPKCQRESTAETHLSRAGVWCANVVHAPNVIF